MYAQWIVSKGAANYPSPPSTHMPLCQGDQESHSFPFQSGLVMWLALRTETTAWQL